MRQRMVDERTGFAHLLCPLLGEVVSGAVAGRADVSTLIMPFAGPMVTLATQAWPSNA